MVHIPGVKNRASDAASRHPTSEPTPPKLQLSDDIFYIFDTQSEDQLPSDDMEIFLMCSAAASLVDIHTVDWNQVCLATSSDAYMLSLLSIIEEGIPDHRHQLPPQLRDYHPLRVFRQY